LNDLTIKGEKIKKIKNMEIGNASPLINPKKFSIQNILSEKPIPMMRSISLGFLTKRNPVKE